MLNLPKSLLDIALDNYDIQASRYYKQLSELEKAPKDVREERKKALEKTKRYLESQRMTSEAMASVQAKLDAYREEGRQLVSKRGEKGIEGRRVLQGERHHPTYKLGRYMMADGKPKPSPEHAAHHIVPGKGRTPESYLARTHMHIRGIRINDPDNGVWLPRSKKFTPHWSMPQAPAHLQCHTNEYEYKVSQRIRGRLAEGQIRTELRLIGKLLQQNLLP